MAKIGDIKLFSGNWAPAGWQFCDGSNSKPNLSEAEKSLQQCRYIICTADSAVDRFAGEIMLFSATYAPAGWKLCDGKLLTIQDYQDLYNVVVSTQGDDGSGQRFPLPNLNEAANSYDDCSFYIRTQGTFPTK